MTIITPAMAATVAYHGFAPTSEHPRWRVFQAIGAVTPEEELAGGPFAWGKGTAEDMRDPLRKAAVLTGNKNFALALCREALQGREDMAAVVATRLQWRLLAGLETGKDILIRHSDVLQVLRDVVDAAKGNDEIIKKVVAERGPIASEAGIGPGGAAFSEIEKNGVPVSKLREDDQ